jgi:hypothetical protein
MASVGRKEEKSKERSEELELPSEFMTCASCKTHIVLASIDYGDVFKCVPRASKTRNHSQYPIFILWSASNIGKKCGMSIVLSFLSS